jgi:hypothetical protein
MAIGIPPAARAGTPRRARSPPGALSPTEMGLARAVGGACVLRAARDAAAGRPRVHARVLRSMTEGSSSGGAGGSVEVCHIGAGQPARIAGAMMAVRPWWLQSGNNHLLGWCVIHEILPWNSGRPRCQQRHKPPWRPGIGSEPQLVYGKRFPAEANARHGPGGVPFALPSRELHCRVTMRS